MHEKTKLSSQKKIKTLLVFKLTKDEKSMFNEQKKRIDIVTRRQHTLPTDINRHVDDSDSEITCSSVMANRTSRPNGQASTIANIQDNEDSNDRLRVIEYNSKLRSNYKDGKKEKRKRKLIEYDYGEEDHDLDNNNQLIQLPEPRLNVQYIGRSSDKSAKTSKMRTSPFASYDYSEDVESKKHLCSLILENFDNLNIIELFNEEANILLQLHLFHLYVYSVVHDQDKTFLETNNGLFNSGTFIKILNNLLQVNELNHNFNATFTPGDNIVTQKKNKKERITEKINVPNIILKRLDIPNES